MDYYTYPPKNIIPTNLEINKIAEKVRVEIALIKSRSK
jgi:hypothetical protein